MKRILVLASLTALAGCGSPGAVGENSADSIKTTAVGSIVGTVPSATPTPDETDANAAAAAAADTANAAAATTDAAAADNSTTTDTTAH